MRGSAQGQEKKWRSRPGPIVPARPLPIRLVLPSSIHSSVRWTCISPLRPAGRRGRAFTLFVHSLQSLDPSVPLHRPRPIPVQLLRTVLIDRLASLAPSPTTRANRASTHTIDGHHACLTEGRTPSLAYLFTYFIATLPTTVHVDWQSPYIPTPPWPALLGRVGGLFAHWLAPRFIIYLLLFPPLNLSLIARTPSAAQTGGAGRFTTPSLPWEPSGPSPNRDTTRPARSWSYTARLPAR